MLCGFISTVELRRDSWTLNCSGGDPSKDIVCLLLPHSFLWAHTHSFRQDAMYKRLHYVPDLTPSPHRTHVSRTDVQPQPQRPLNHPASSLTLPSDANYTKLFCFLLPLSFKASISLFATCVQEGNAEFLYLAWNKEVKMAYSIRLFISHWPDTSTLKLAAV